jgi:excisionase family DNA binding protein
MRERSYFMPNIAPPLYGRSEIGDDEVFDWKVRGLSHGLVRATARELEELFAGRHEAGQRDTQPALTVAELAEQLGKSSHATYRLLKQGRIPGTFNDGAKTRWYIPTDAADRYFNRGER